MTRFKYDAVNRLVKVTDPAPFQTQTVETTYEDAANRVREKDRNDILRITQLDPLGRTRSVTRAGIPLERHEYDGDGNRIRSLDAESRETRFSYDPANRLSARTDGFATPVAATTRFRYDGNGNLTEELDPRSAAAGDPFSVRKAYDELNRLISMTDALGHTTRYGYDPEGNRTSLVEPKGQTTAFEYDELGKLTKVTQPEVGGGGSPVTTYQYDAVRNRIRQTDANGHVVEMVYDQLNRLASMTQDPGGLSLVTSHEYDAQGNELKLIDPKGQVVTSTYDALNRLHTKAYAFAEGDSYRPWRRTQDITYGYDSNGNVLQVDETVASGNDPPDTETKTTLWEYDDLDRLKKEVTPLPDGGTREVAYTYYANGTRKSVKDPAGRVTEYSYDGQNRLETATTDFDTPDARLTTYTYLPDDLLDKVTYPNGVVATHGYDKADRLTSLANAGAGGPVSSYVYGYDPNGNRLGQKEQHGTADPEDTTYGYDALNRLASVAYPDKVVTYGYDPVGNRTRETETDVNLVVLADKQGVFDNANRLLSLTDAVAPANNTAFTWDPNGNQTSKTAAAVTTEYRYDVRDKLVEVQRVGDPVPIGLFQYDFQGRRNKKIGEGLPGDTIRQYVYDQTSLLAEYNVLGTQVAKYDYGSDRLISLFRQDEGRRYFSFDGLGSVVSLTDDPGTTKARYHLDAFGQYRFPTELNASNNRFAFTGFLFDEETGLYDAKARYYDSEVGRFTSQDPLLGNGDEPPSLHRYVYGWNRPTFFVDPNGHEVLPAGCYTGGNCFNDAVRPTPVVVDAAKAFGGAVYGVGEVLAAPGVLTYQLTGAFLYNVTGEWQYRAQAESFSRTAEGFDRAFESPQALVTTVAQGFTSQLDRFSTSIEKGDAFEAGAGFGNAAGQVLTAVEGAKGAPSVSVAPARALATATGQALRTGAGAVVVTGGGGSAAAAGILLSSNVKGNEGTTVKENTPRKNDPSLTKQEPAIKQHQREGARRERATQADLEQEHPQASVQRERLLRDAAGKKVRDPLTETGRRVDHVVIEQGEVTRSVETTSPTADKAAQIAKEQRVRQSGGNFVRDRQTGEVVAIKEGVTTEVVRRE